MILPPAPPLPNYRREVDFGKSVQERAWCPNVFSFSVPRLFSLPNEGVMACFVTLVWCWCVLFLLKLGFLAPRKLTLSRSLKRPAQGRPRSTFPLTVTAWPSPSTQHGNSFFLLNFTSILAHGFSFSGSSPPSQQNVVFLHGVSVLAV